ncbi:MAG: hypothetical protein ACHQ2Y_03380 [Candidatus Lutacidiplasmatales archaeon]
MVAILGLYGAWYFDWPILGAAAISAIIGSSILFIAAYGLTKSNYPSELLLQYLRDEDGIPSLSRLQLFLWTSIVVYAFTWVALIRLFSGTAAFSGSVSADLPPNLVAIMGISVGSALASAAIQRKVKPNPSYDKGSWSNILVEIDSSGHGAPSLGRFQMLAWTVISVTIYVTVLILRVAHFWSNGPVSTLTLPDLDTTLVVLMGISHTGYVGSKYVTRNAATTP